MRLTRRGFFGMLAAAAGVNTGGPWGPSPLLEPMRKLGYLDSIPIGVGFIEELRPESVFPVVYEKPVLIEISCCSKDFIYGSEKAREAIAELARAVAKRTEPQYLGGGNGTLEGRKGSEARPQHAGIRDRRV